MARIQSSNITTLCTQLGFPPDGELHERDPKEFKREAAEFRVRFAQQGHPLPFHEPYSIEAEKYALAFCQEDDRGEKLWPPNHHDWPSWVEDRREILRCLTHIFGLQAYYQYQREGKAKKKTETSMTPSIPETEEIARELSPQSRLYVGPSPPRGTKRRPVKVTTEGTDNSVEMSMRNNGSGPDADGVVGREVHEACKEEIAALDPRRDDKPIKEFTLQWLTKTGSRWPVQADPRLKTYMHQHNYYDNEDEDCKLVEVIRNLRKGTEIESCEAEHYNLLKRRLLERVGVLARDLIAKGLVQQQVGQKPQKTLCFKDYWQHRHSSWGPAKMSAKKTPPRIINIYDFDMSDEDVGGSPSLPHRSTQRLTGKVNEAARSPTSRKADEMHGTTLGGNKHKRQKMSANPPFAERPSSAVSAITTVAPANDPEHTNVSSSHTEPDENNNYIEEALSYLDDQRGDTPQQPTGGQGPLNAENPNISERRSNLRAPGEDQHPKATIKDQTSLSESHTSSGRDDRQRLVLVLQKSARDLDLDFNNTLPSTRLRNTNVSQFFQLYSERAKVPLEALDCLTFTLTFVGGNEEVVRQGDEAAWRRLINTTRVLFMLQSKRCPSTKEFQIVVEIGDKTTGVVPVPYDDVW